MAFMDVMKKVEKTNVEAGVPKVNPLLQKLNASKTTNGDVKKPNPLLKPKAAATDAAPSEDKTIQQKAVEEAKAILKAKEEEKVVEKVEEEVTQETTPKVAETVEEKVEEEVTITVPTTEVAEAIKTEEAVVEEKEEPVEETKTETKKKRRNTKKTAPKVAEKTSVEDETVEVFTTRISYEDAVNAIRGPFSNNEEFEMLKEEIVEELNNIVISEDINSITAKTVNAQLSALYQKVWFEHQAAKTFFENLTQKDNGLIDVVKYSSIGEGSNDAQRKKAGIEACMRYVAPGATEPVNLFEVLAFAREQYYFFDSVMKHLAYKKDVMISMNAALKIEDKVLGSGTQIN